MKYTIRYEYDNRYGLAGPYWAKAYDKNGFCGMKGGPSFKEARVSLMGELLRRKHERASADEPPPDEEVEI